MKISFMTEGFSPLSQIYPPTKPIVGATGWSPWARRRLALTVGNEHFRSENYKITMPYFHIK
ncbi:hypothetical protein KKB18_10460 [bacterium]|nr:hypothetical protein [bacterium]